MPKPIALRLPDELLSYLTERAEREHRSLSNMVISILLDAMENDEQKRGVNTMNKSELKAYLKDELKCDDGFIKRLDESGILAKLQKAYTDDDQIVIKDLTKEINLEYKDYCKMFSE